LAILDYLTAHPTATRRQLTAHLSDFNPGSVRNALVQLTRSGLIKRANDGHRGAKALYALTN
jgi:DNA-binding IclR family transcriptional regulator